MGRQIQLSMLPSDRDSLLDEIRSKAPVEVAKRDGDSAAVQIVPAETPGILILWNKQFAPTLQREFVASATPPYYRVDESVLPVLEFSPSWLTEWEGKAALTQGRVYGQFAGKPVEFEKWFERIVRYIRKHWRKNPVPHFGGYVGPAASEWFDSGGLLLPMFVPPATADWIRVMSRQHPPTTIRQ